MSWYREEYLKSEDWKNLRNAILYYQDYLCESCGGRATDVHHLLYRKIWDVKPLDLMALCRPCHTAVHDWLDIKIDPPGAKKKTPSKKAGIALRCRIATNVSPRGMVEFNLCLGKNRNYRMAVFDKKTGRKPESRTPPWYMRK